MLRRSRAVVAAGLLAMIGVLPAQAQTLQENNEKMFREMQAARGLSGAEMQKIRSIFAGSRYMGIGYQIW